MSEEWKLVAESPFVRFKPRRPMTNEARTVQLPLAAAIAQGHVIRDFGPCIVLVSLRLEHCPPSGRELCAPDLTMLSASGEVGLVECKCTKAGANAAWLAGAQCARAKTQLARYKRSLGRLTAKDLQERICVTYHRFMFPGIGNALDALKVDTDSNKGRWWQRIEYSLREGRIRCFVAAGARPEDVWLVDRLPEVPR